MRYKALLCINYIKRMFRNPSRMILTLTGLVLSVMILVTGLVFAETYMRSKTKRIDMYYDNSAIQIEGMYQYDVYHDISEIARSAKIDLISNRYYKAGEVSYKDKRADIYITDIRTDSVDVGCLNEEITGSQRFESSLLAGKLIEEDDIRNKNKVAVIYDTLAETLFGKNDPIGESLVFPVYRLNEELGIMELAYYDELKIVGVIRDRKKVKDYFDDASDQGEGTLSISFPVYTPLSLEINKTGAESSVMRITAYADRDEYFETVGEIELCAASYRKTEYKVYSYFSLKEDAKKELTTAKEGIFILVLAMLVISGICISNTMLFSVKERINEIGIRKSIGADAYDILLQFVLEGVVYGLISGLIGILICMIIDPIVYLVLIEKSIWMPEVPLSFELPVLCLALGTAVLISTLAGIIPAVYASRIKIADAIRFE